MLSYDAYKVGRTGFGGERDDYHADFRTAQNGIGCLARLSGATRFTEKY